MQRGRPFTIYWQESEDELFEKYRGEKNLQRRTRLQGLWQLRKGKSLEEVSQLLGVSYRTLQRWIAWYRQGGLEEVLRRIPGHNAPGGLTKLTGERLVAVKEQMDSGAFRTAREMRIWIQKQWGVSYTAKGIYGVLRGLRAKKKVPRPQSEQASVEAQQAWKKGACELHS